MEQGAEESNLGNTYFGQHQEVNREKRVRFQREPVAGDPPYKVSIIDLPQLSPRQLQKLVFIHFGMGKEKNRLGH